jgi:excisionase family DNA binding protein
MYRRVLDERWDGFTTFTVTEAGQILRLSRASAYNAVKAGHLPAVKIGRRMVIARAVLEALLMPA